MSNIAKLLAFLETAEAVTIDGGSVLTDWEVAEVTGSPQSQLVRFAWTDGECDFSDTLTEGGIEAGEFDGDGKFVAQNAEGEPTVIRFFTLARMRLPGSGATAAKRFMNELLEATESLTAIAEMHGHRTLADLMYLFSAIQEGGFIDHYPDESSVLEIVQELPSAPQWMQFIKVEYLAQPIAEAMGAGSVAALPGQDHVA
jgi:hypothetical protein